MLKLHDLTVGQRFTFSDKHRGKTFEVTSKDRFSVVYMDVATGEDRMALSNRKTFRMEVELVTENRVVEFTQQEADMLADILHNYYKLLCERNAPEPVKSDINKLYLKLTDLPGRRVVKEGE